MCYSKLENKESIDANIICLIPMAKIDDSKCRYERFIAIEIITSRT